jgi:mannose-6-phosphate isomerase-like protein (cupin superfamily)
MTTGPRGESPSEQAPYARRMSRESSVSYLDCLFSVLAGSEQTDGRFGLLEMVAPKGREPSRHLHYTDDEGFYVLEGELTFYVGEKTYAAGPGTFDYCRMACPTPTPSRPTRSACSPSSRRAGWRSTSATLAKPWPQTWRATAPR